MLGLHVLASQELGKLRGCAAYQASRPNPIAVSGDPRDPDVR